MDATILALQAGNATPTPVAVVIPVTTPTTNVPATAPSSGGPTAPLAIAAAAIAASSQPLAAPPGPSDPAKTDSGTTPTTTAGSAATKTAAPLPGLTATAQASTAISANTAPVTTTVAAAAPVTPKTAQGKGQAAPAATGSPTTNSAPADPDATSTTTAAGQNGLAPQSSAAGKQETANAAIQGATAEEAAATPAAPAHDRAAAANTTHVPADSVDPATQAMGSFQPQLNSTSALTSASNLTVTAATNGAVPLSGLALQIAANVKSGRSSFEIRLDPADLGRIDVRVDIDRNGQVTSHLTVEKPETLSMLRQDAPQLQQALNDAGLKTGSDGLQFSLRDQSSSGQNGGNGNNPNAQQLIISDEDAVPASVAGRSYGRSLSSSGGVDIRV